MNITRPESLGWLKPVITKSPRPYLFILGAGVIILILGLLLNSPTIGGIYGASLAAITPRYDPIFFFAVIGLYFFKRPWISIISMVIASIFYQAFFLDNSRDILGLGAPSIISLPRIYGGLLLLSLIGSIEFLYKKFAKISSTNPS